MRTVESDKISDIINAISEETRAFGRCVYRGQTNADWKLVPSLYRLRKVYPNNGMSVEQHFDSIERIIIAKFFDNAIAHMPLHIKSDIHDRIVAQHYGAPTCLLDWTKDPLVALYFALERYDDESDAAVYYISCAQTSRTTSARVVFPYSGPIVVIQPPMLDARITAQKSVFTLQKFGDYDDRFQPLEERTLKNSAQREGLPHINEVNQFGKIIIPKKYKPRLMEQLLGFSVDAMALFPGLDGVGRDSRQRTELTRWRTPPTRRDRELANREWSSSVPEDLRERLEVIAANDHSIVNDLWAEFRDWLISQGIKAP